MDTTKLNPEFQKLEVDYLYHLGLDSSMDLKAQFGDVRFVVFTRSFSNADYFANQLIQEIFDLKGIQVSAKTIAKDERYHIYKVANTLIISHGVGFPSMLICLNEVVKLLWHAGVDDYKFIRLSAGGGLNVAEDSVLVATEALNQQLEPIWSNIEFAATYSYPTPLDQTFVQELIAASPTLEVSEGKVLSTSCFYNGQARLNGAIPVSYSAEESQRYLNKAYQAGVRGIDMESSCFAAFCHNFKIPAAVVLAILVDRLSDDSEPVLHLNHDKISPVFRQAGQLIINYIVSSTRGQTCVSTH